MNLYTYCANNPIIFVDPSGHIFVVDDVVVGLGIAAASCLIASSASLTASVASKNSTLNIDSDTKKIIGVSLLYTLVPNFIIDGLLINGAKSFAVQETSEIHSLFSTNYENYDPYAPVWEQKSRYMINQVKKDYLVNSIYNSFNDTVDFYINSTHNYANEIYATSVETLNGLSDILIYAKSSKLSGKERASDIPSWAKGEKPLEGESGKDFAKRLCDDKYGKDNYNTGPGSEYNKLRKYGDRGFN